MLSEKEMSLLYETIMSAPGMSEMVKVDLKMPRKNVLLLAKVIEKGLQSKASDVDGLVNAASDGSFEALQRVGTDLLNKSRIIGYAYKAHFF
ncbi:MAG: hypothetical protein PW786_13470 [Arachidicoccus sp.]|nr:hypothetical protein [Arachidicoccus sp.]